jgi:hypothetical protein
MDENRRFLKKNNIERLEWREGRRAPTTARPECIRAILSIELEHSSIAVKTIFEDTVLQ